MPDHACYSGRMKVSAIYTQYKISPFLQLHQLRVAAVSKMLAENVEGSLDMRALVIAALFHDMGNIIKFDFTKFPETTDPEGLVYWQRVQKDFVRRYGPDEHHATIAIGHELHLPLQAMRYIEQVGFSKLIDIRASRSMELKIVEYADTRVAPYGVTSQAERLEEGRARYADRPQFAGADQERYAGLVEAAQDIERQIFEKTNIKPEDITEERIQPLIEELRDFKIG